MKDQGYNIIKRWYKFGYFILFQPVVPDMHDSHPKTVKNIDFLKNFNIYSIVELF